MNPPKALISYTHDSPEHRQRVLALAQRLRAHGVDAVCDQFVNGSPAEGWPQWMLNQIETATHVICICTPSYYRRFRGKEEPGRGKGATWEGFVITQAIYDSNARNTKFIPGAFGRPDEASIPEPLRAATHYDCDAGYQALYDAILGQSGVEPAPLGALNLKPRASTAVATASNSTTAAAPGASTPDTSEPTPEELANVFAGVIASIEDTLATAPNAARFLGTEAPPAGRFVSNKDGALSVLEKYRQGGVNVCPPLESIWRRLPLQFRAAKHEWQALEQVVGGIIVLGLSPKWVWLQRQRLPQTAIQFPKRADSVNLGEHGRAQFLTVLSAALADGVIRLERAFGPLDARRIPDLNRVSPGITQPDRLTDIKRHFVHFVLGPREDLESLSNEELDTEFRRVKNLITIAHQPDRNPILGAGVEMSKLEHEIKNQLELADFFLFIPKEPEPGEKGDEFDLMTDPVIALVTLKRIHDLIQKLRPEI